MRIKVEAPSGAVEKRGPGRPREFDRLVGLRTAAELFRSCGYEAVSMADLREALGVTQASLYAAYGNKQTLFEGAVSLYLEEKGGSTARALAGETTAKAAVEKMLRDAIGNFAAQPSGTAGCLLVLGAGYCSAETQVVTDRLKSLRLHNFELIEKRMRRGIRAGDVPPSAPVKAVAGFYATTLHGLSIQARDAFAPKALHAIADCAMSAWDGLLGL